MGLGESSGGSRVAPHHYGRWASGCPRRGGDVAVPGSSIAHGGAQSVLVSEGSAANWFTYGVKRASGGQGVEVCVGGRVC